MGEIRKDYLLDNWVLYSSIRRSRPFEFIRREAIRESKQCVFCPGNEKLTPKEKGRIPKKGQWRIRWFENKYPAVVPRNHFIHPKTKDRFYTSAHNYGYHEIIVETSSHKEQMHGFSKEKICRVLEVYKQRFKELMKKKDIQNVFIFKNAGVRGGTSIVHSHSQLIATPIVPQKIRHKIEAAGGFKKCPYCRIVAQESKSKRKCFENNNWVAFCPYASRYSYEVWIFPKKHISDVTQVADLSGLAEILKKCLVKAHAITSSYNFALCSSPKKKNMHFHIELYPQASFRGGFERGSGMVINTVLPEQAAKYYGGSK